MIFAIDITHYFKGIFVIAIQFLEIELTLWLRFLISPVVGKHGMWNGTVMYSFVKKII